MKILNTAKNIFDLPVSEKEAVCVTTNGMVKRNGFAVMGAGIAREADLRFGLSAKLGQYLRAYGNRTFYMGAYQNKAIICFPTKHNWRDSSDLALIRESAENLVRMCDNRGITKCYLPPVGCGLGGLDWDTQVAPLLNSILDDRFVIVFRAA